MIEVFELKSGCKAAELYELYQGCMDVVRSSERLPAPMKDTFMHILNEAYDAALSETQEAQEAVTSPRPS